MIIKHHGQIIPSPHQYLRPVADAKSWIKDGAWGGSFRIIPNIVHIYNCAMHIDLISEIFSNTSHTHTHVHQILTQKKFCNHLRRIRNYTAGTDQSPKDRCNGKTGNQFLQQKNKNKSTNFNSHSLCLHDLRNTVKLLLCGFFR